MPVITAHPSEVRRKSVIDRVSRIAETFDALDRAPPTNRPPIEARTRPPDPDPVGDPPAAADQPGRGRRDRERRSRSSSAPSCASCRASIAGRWRGGAGRGGTLPSFLRIGSWVGGDRDGNPNVTAETLRLALLTQSRLVVSHYLEEMHALGAELSLSLEHVDGRRRSWRRWRTARGDRSPPSAATSPTAAPCRASMPASRPPRRR